MNVEKALSMVEPKQKLRNLEAHLPGQQKVVYRFGAFLAEYLNDELVPMGFVMGCLLALHDLECGVSGFDNKPITNNLVGLPPIIYPLLQRRIPQIAAAIFPAEFAAAVEKDYAEAEAEIRKRRTQ